MRFEALHVPQKIVGHVKLLWFLYRDPRTPKIFKILVWIVFLYLLMPLDIIPDFIPVLGQLDDLLVILIGLKFLIRLCPPELVKECRDRIQT